MWSISYLFPPCQHCQWPCETHGLSWVVCSIFLTSSWVSSPCHVNKHPLSLSRAISSLALRVWSRDRHVLCSPVRPKNASFFLRWISGHQSLLPAALPWFCHSTGLEVFSHWSCFSFSSGPLCAGDASIYLLSPTHYHFHSLLLPTSLTVDFNSISVRAAES